MSMFLGPIHFWMYNKIEINWRREGQILKVFKDKYGEEAEEVAGKKVEDFEVFNGGKPLEELVEGLSIHGWLQSQLDVVEASEAKTASALVTKYGKEGERLALEAAFKYGVACGRQVAEEKKGQKIDLQTSYEMLQNYQLDGMPCDHVTDLRAANGGLTCRHFECLHMRNWEAVGGSSKLMCDLIRIWIDGFYDGLGAGISHKAGASIAAGAKECEDYFVPTT